MSKKRKLKDTKDGYIYVLSIGFDDIYKIGCTQRPKMRLSGLSSANPRAKYMMRYLVLDMRGVEKFLHKRFSPVHHSKELFVLDSANLIWIRNYLRGEQERFIRSRRIPIEALESHPELITARS